MSEHRFRVSPGKGMQPFEFVMQPGQRVRLGRGEGQPDSLATTRGEPLGRVDIPAPTVSHEHVELRLTDGTCQVADTGSKNGTWVRLSEQHTEPLGRGEHIYLGRDVKIEYLEEAQAQATPGARTEAAAGNGAVVSSTEGLLQRLQRALAACAQVYFYPSRDPRKEPPDRVFPLVGEARGIGLKWRDGTRREQLEQEVAEQVNLHNIQQRPQAALPGDFAAGTPVRRRLLELAQRVAPTNLSVLILGPHGSGKDVLARDIHLNSRRTGPFVPINCGALSEPLIASELFGHTRGSFTGALQDRAGLFRAAHGGTLFLDEIGEMPLTLQAVLLRVLETGRVRRLGANTEEAVDVRIIAATNRDLDARARAGSFRADLLFRLAECRLFVPPLESADIWALVPRLLQELQTRLFGEPASSAQSPVPSPALLSPNEEDELGRLAAAQSWQGSVRELRNALKRFLLMRRPEQSLAAAWKESLEMGGPGLAEPAAELPEPETPEPADAGESGTESGSTGFKLDEISMHLGRVAFLTELDAALSSSRRGEYQTVGTRLGIKPPAVWGRLQRLELVAQAGDRVNPAEVQRLLRKSREALLPHLERLLRYIRG